MTENKHFIYRKGLQRVRETICLTVGDNYEANLVHKVQLIISTM